MADSSDTKDCPLCGETIKAVAIRCKHCQADLSLADFDRGTKPVQRTPGAALSDVEFEQHFLDFAYEAREPLNAISVAHALKIPIAQADDKLENLAASDVILRHVDDDGAIFYTLPGRHRAVAQLARTGVGPGALVVPLHGHDPFLVGPPPPTEAAAVTGLVLNMCMPGVGSIVAGKPGPGIAQLAMLVAGVPLCFVLIGFPLVFAAWLWSIMTAAGALQEARRTPATM
ncbi:MAG: hypothetical protein ABI321_02325 [Polyangia bacterium]